MPDEGWVEGYEKNVLDIRVGTAEVKMFGANRIGTLDQKQTRDAMFVIVKVTHLDRYQFFAGVVHMTEIMPLLIVISTIMLHTGVMTVRSYDYHNKAWDDTKYQRRTCLVVLVQHRSCLVFGDSHDESPAREVVTSKSLGETACKCKLLASTFATDSQVHPARVLVCGASGRSGPGQVARRSRVNAGYCFVLTQVGTWRDSAWGS